MKAGLRVGIDIGGTFTDFVIYDPETTRMETFKILSTPSNPAEAVIAGMELVRKKFGGDDYASWDIVHGSTVATNSLLERKGARTAFIATRGFKDILQIGRQNRPTLYDLSFEPTEPLVPADLRFEVDERVDFQGRVLRNLESDQVKAVIPILRSNGVKSVAVCLLFSFLHAQHEQLITQYLREAGFFVSASVEIMPEFREYERASTTAVNAYVSPVLEKYLTSLESNLGRSIRVMVSNGGSMGMSEARKLGVNCILSGPAGGVVGAMKLSSEVMSGSGGIRLVTFDMGGTSTDVSLVDGEPKVTVESLVGGCPIHIPLLDIYTIGAGGGSLAYLDSGGALRVGPQSAGADPGPACYGSGSQPTVTDANLVLGRLLPGNFLGGAMQLHPERSQAAFRNLAAQLQMDEIESALGVIEVANAHMERALRLISVERGHDPRDFSLFSFGGAGGLHAADLARRIGIQQVVVSPLASTLSAFGMLSANVVKDYVQTVMLPGDVPIEEIQQGFDPMIKRGLEEVNQEGIPTEHIRCELFLDMRLRGQSYELTVPFQDHFVTSFHNLHQQLYGYQRLDAQIEIVNLRARAVGLIPDISSGRLVEGGRDSSHAMGFTSRIAFQQDGGFIWQEVPVYNGEKLLPNNELKGAALVVYKDTTVLLHRGDSGRIDLFGNLMIQVGKV